MLDINILELGKLYSLTFLFFTVFVTLCLASYIQNVKKWNKFKLPPGPLGITILGNIAGIMKDPHLKLSEWAAKHGGLYTISIFHKKALVVNDVKLLKELFGTMASTGKMKTETFLLLSQGSHGIINTEGQVWLEQRQFCAKNLKQLGFGQVRSMEPLILNEVEKVCNWIRVEISKSKKEVIHLEQVLFTGAINSLWTLVTGERFKMGDSKMGNHIKKLVVTAQYTMKTGLGFCSWLKYIAPNLSGYVEYDKACKNIHNFIEDKFKEHKTTYEVGKERNLIDMYIAHMNKMNSSEDGRNSSFFGKEGWINSMSSVAELFMTGGETVSVSFTWAANYLSCRKKVQKKLQDEIDSVLGRERNPALSDRPRMPCTEAVILETLRLSSFGPLGIPHELLEDINFHEYRLPKGLILIANMYHIHHDPEIWGDPQEFRPDRFLGNDGERLKGFLVPFQAGKRQCLGEPLAKDTMFLFVAKLFQQFDMSPEPGVPFEDYFKGDMGIALLPITSGLVISAR